MRSDDVYTDAAPSHCSRRCQPGIPGARRSPRNIRNVRNGVALYRGQGERTGTRLLSPPHHGLPRLLFGFTSFSPDCRRALSSALAFRREFRFMAPIYSRLPSADPLPRSGLARF
jgi:hypothetical protein